MTVDGPDIDRAACPAAWTIHVKPRHAGDYGAADGRRPQRAAAGCKRGVPSLNDMHRFVTCRLLSRTGAHAERKAIGPRRIVFRHSASIGWRPELRH